MEYATTGFLLSLSLCLELGLVNIAVVRTGVLSGFRPALLMGLGSSIGDLIYASIAFTSINILLDSIIVRWFLWIVGSIVLLYLAADMIKKSFNRTDKLIFSKTGYRKKHGSFITGFGLALSSPSAILWFMTIGGSLIATSTDNSLESIVLFFIGFFIAGILWAFALALLSSKMGEKVGDRFNFYFSWASACIFLYFAAFVFYNGYTTLI